MTEDRNKAEKPRPFLEVRGLRKDFGGVRALEDIDLQVYPGEVHGLVGANGAGKSTLIKILAGLQSPDAGTVLIDGEPVNIQDSQRADRLGLQFIHQELNLVPKFNSLQNITLGLPKATRFGLVNWRAEQRQVAAVTERLGMNFPLDIPVENLSVANQWLVSMGRALVRKARLIAMDEPTASLSPVESERLFRVVEELSEDGISIIYVSHRLDEILDLCDRVTVFKNGERVSTVDRQSITRGSLIRDIVGGEFEETSKSSPVVQNDGVLLEARNLRREPAVRGVSFVVHRGEILGLAGLVGSGRSELVRLIFGADTAESGEVLLDGEPLRPRGPYDAVKKGVGLVPEERRSQGLVLTKSVAFNLNLSSLRSLRLTKWLPFMDLRRRSRRSTDMARRLAIKAPSVSTEVGRLSGGNQQKVVIGKWLTKEARFLMLDEPSRGVDIGARAEIHTIIRELVGGGAGVLVISSEEEELVGLCDRVLVMADGRMVGELSGVEITREAILRLSYAHGEREAKGESS